jgi:hypothetical protein
MPLLRRDASCDACGTEFTESPRRTFLGFLKLQCPACKADLLYPLTPGYRLFYVLVTLGAIAWFVGTPQARAMPGVLALWALGILGRDYRICSDDPDSRDVYGPAGLKRWLRSCWYWDRIEPNAVLVRNWRRALLAEALLFPLLAWAGGLLLTALGRLSLVNVDPGVSLAAQVHELPYALALILLDWPFLVYRAIVTRQLRVNRRPVRATHWACTGGCIGLSLPYAYGWYVLAALATSAPSDGGQGQAIGFYLAIFAPPFGAVLALIGWHLGYWLSRWRPPS